MSGEINGTKVLLRKGGSTIVGQMEVTVTQNGTPIDITNKSTDDWRTLLNGELAGKGIDISGTIIYTDDAAFRALRADAWSGAQDTYDIIYTSDANTDEQISGTFVPTGLSDSIPMGDKVTTSITLLSSGAPTRTAAA